MLESDVLKIVINEFSRSITETVNTLRLAEVIDGMEDVVTRFNYNKVFLNVDECMEFIRWFLKKKGIALQKDINIDPVARPSYYVEGRKYEPRKVISDWGLNFNLGNVVKYVSRAGRKGDESKRIEDLRKAKQYLEFELEDLFSDQNE